jgi:hypothetical protein
MPKLIAHFEDADAARDAAFELEAKGFDAADVVVHVPTDALVQRDQVAAVDLEVTGELWRHSLAGLLLGAIAGATLLTVLVMLAVRDAAGLAVVLAALGGAMFGGYAGFFWGGASRLPVNEQVFDTEAPAANEVDVEVLVDDEQEATLAKAVLRDHGALV